MHTRAFAIAFAASTVGLLLAHTAAADVVWNEADDGDLSNDRLNPTPITLALGVNSLMATSVSGDREYFTFTLADGLELSALILVSYEGDDGIAFIAVQNGTTFTEPPTKTNVENLLGWAHFGPGVGNVGTDILDDIGEGIGAIGFTPPLPAGPYTFWAQQTGMSATTYQLDFIVTPAPSGALVLMLMLGRRLSRKRRTM